MSPFLRRTLAFLVPCVAVVTFASLLIAVAAQQVVRQGANDPQQQLAEDAAARLNAGEAPDAVVPVGSVDLATSLAPFVAVYRADRTVAASNALLDAAVPVPPPGVLETARSAGIDRVTWQPRSGVRIALVAIGWKDGTVVAGRSLRRVEEIEASLEQLVVVGWIAALAAVGLASLVAASLWPRARTAG